MSEILKASGEQVEKSAGNESLLEKMPTFEEAQAQKLQQQHQTLVGHLEFLKDKMHNSDNLERRSQIEEEINATKKSLEKTAEGEILNVEGLETYSPEEIVEKEQKAEQVEEKRKIQAELYKKAIKEARAKYAVLVAAGKKSRAERLKLDIEQANEELLEILDGKLIDGGSAPDWIGH